MRFWLLVLALLFVGCDYDIITPTPVVNVNSTNTNTNTNTNTTTTTVDRSDTEPTPAPPGSTPPPSPGGVLPLPAYGETVTLQLGAANPTLVQKSCQTTDGAQAWAFMDLLVSTLQARDARWGYLCKDANCSTFGRDVVAYKAGATDLGIWIVDVLGNHCPGPGDSPTQVRWGVLPFETVRRWSATR